MTQAEAIALAEKREKHKGKSLSHKRWQACHDSIKGWHVALVDVVKPALPAEHPNIDSEILLEIGALILMERVKRTLGL